MFSRIGRFFKAIFNAILGEAEGQIPVAMLEQSVREMLDNLRSLREATATTIAFETKGKRDLDAQNGRVKNLDAQAEEALRQGNEKLARRALQLQVEAKATRGGVGNAGKVLEAHEGDAATADHHFTSVRRADADHEHDVDVAVDLEEQPALFFGGACERDHVGSIEHGAQIGALTGYRVTGDFLEVRARRLDDVVVPIRFEHRPVRVEVPLVRDHRIRALQHREEIGQQVDQHGAVTRSPFPVAM